MKEARENAKSILTAYEAAVKKATEELVANESLSGDRLRQILEEYPPAGDYTKTGQTPQDFTDGRRRNAKRLAKRTRSVEKV